MGSQTSGNRWVGRGEVSPNAQLPKNKKTQGGGTPAEGPEGEAGGGRLGSGHPQKTIQSLDKLYKDQTDTIQRPKELDKTFKNIQAPQKGMNLKSETGVTTNTNLTKNIRYPILKPHILIKDVLLFIKRSHILIRALFWPTYVQSTRCVHHTAIS